MRFVKDMFKRPAPQKEEIYVLGQDTVRALDNICAQFNLSSRVDALRIAIALMDEARKAEEKGDCIGVLDGKTKAMKHVFTYGDQYQPAPSPDTPPKHRKLKFRL